MALRDPQSWTPFRPAPEELRQIEEDVTEVRAIQQTLLDHHPGLQVCDRVAHQYQIAGGKVTLVVADALPAEMDGVGLFVPGATHAGVGRISTGLGVPHVEPGLDFLGIMLAFATAAGRRVDFLGINHPASPTDTHQEFVSLLHATGESAAADVPLLGGLGDRDLVNLVAEQTRLVLGLRRRLGLRRALGMARHLVAQTVVTFRSKTAYQPYWTGIVELGGKAGKFTLLPAGDEAARPAGGERRLSDEWKRRQGEGDVVFRLYWIPYLDAERTPMRDLSTTWEEAHRIAVGTVAFPRADLAGEEARHWATLAAEMGANPGHWVHDREDSVGEPATVFGCARKLAYRMSQEGREALDPATYEEVFRSGAIGPGLARELERRQLAKDRLGHVRAAP